jgi:hypothetical protein
MLTPPDNDTPTSEPPSCSACGRAMRLTKVQPAYFYEGRNEHVYSCECRATVTIFVDRGRDV